MIRLRIDLDYENGVSFEMTTKVDDEDKVSIIKVEENGRIGDLWADVASICNTYFGAELLAIGDIMKAD